MAPAGKPRTRLTAEQEERLQALYKEVPRQTLIVHGWRTPAGIEFQEYVRELTTRYHVPQSWVAEAVGVPSQTIAQALSR